MRAVVPERVIPTNHTSSVALAQPELSGFATPG